MARKILLADDSVTAQNMGRKILADAGYEVITVNNGSAALKKISEQKPDLIVLDVYMPGYSGLEVCQRVKEVGETSRIPILLTVGKLEPFKPEEAKRVRADGFIVKPFEASELLSALSKLEDRIVPRSETSKTGRFARATAAIDEGRFDKTVAADDEDSGWKNRISFPPKKKKAVEAEAEETSAPVAAKKDSRAETEHKVEPAAAHTEAASHAEEKHVNLAALAPEGLPKDVTPEEIAALAAAAAQVKGKLADEKPAAPLAEMAVHAPIETEAPKVESKEVTPSAELSPAPEVAVAAPAPTTFAEHNTAEKIDEQKTESEVVSTQADAMTAIMGLETQMFAVHSPTREDGSAPNGGASPTQEPVTMAVAAPAYSGPSVSRWTAVAVALTPEDSPVSLEEEMQKAFAAAAAASASHSAAVETVPEPAPVSSVSTAELDPVPAAVIEPAVPVEAPAAEAVAPAPPEVAPEAAESTAVTEAISAAVKELESVAASYVAEQTPAPVESVTPQPVEPAAETSTPSVAENSQVADAKAELTPVAEAVAPVAEAKAEIVPEVVPETVEAPAPQASHRIHSREEWSEARTENVEAVSETAAPSPVHEPVPVHDVVEQHENEHEVSAEPAAAVSGPRIAGGTEDMGKRESETAAAWASWRKIRETGVSKPSASAETSEKESEETSAPRDKAAMAVAVGAESSPEEVAGSLDSDPEIASIVDSVLADMRPKIVEEIARKLGKKK